MLTVVVLSACTTEQHAQVQSTPFTATDDLSAFVWQGSIQGGYVDGWDYDEALRIFGGEGGNDNCQFNTQGSGACGFGQQLPCFEGALTFDGQFSIIMAKFQDGRRRFPDRSGFWAHWLQFYR